VTGGSSGIGRAIAARLGERGTTVALVARGERRLRDAADELEHGAAYRAASVADRREITDAVESLVAELGRLDVLVNAAGFGGQPVTTDQDPDEAQAGWEETLATDLTGCFHATLAAARHLTRPGGRIVNISSIAAHNGGNSPGRLAYSAAKAGLIGLTYALARELGPDGITVNAVAPGFVPDTGFFAEPPSEEHRQATLARLPLDRLGEPTDIAAAVDYLSSEDAGWVTGQVLSVNGGELFGR
jgi:3-oxoacyl-[acyl-carrier protein] reductase